MSGHRPIVLDNERSAAANAIVIDDDDEAALPLLERRRNAAAAASTSAASLPQHLQQLSTMSTPTPLITTTSENEATSESREMTTTVTDVENDVEGATATNITPLKSPSKSEMSMTARNAIDQCGWLPAGDLSVERVRSILRMPTTINDDAEFDEALANTPSCFCELMQLRFNRFARDVEWKQTVRWVKFEEQVDSGKRWSKPFVSSLSMSALLELRSYLQTSSLLLDLSCTTLRELFEKVVDVWIEDGALSVHEQSLALETLLKNYRHQHESNESKVLQQAAGTTAAASPHFAFGGAETSTPKEARRVNERSPISTDPPSGVSSAHTTIGTSSVRPATATSMHSTNTSASHPHHHHHHHTTTSSSFFMSKSPSSTLLRQPNISFRKKLPSTCESISILVGACEFLHERASLFAFVRLHHARVFESFNEVDLPTRFVCILLVPASRRRPATQVGRSIGGLFTDLLFRSVCYEAQQRLDMLFGIDEFINAVTVLPPGTWDATIRLEPPSDVPSQISRLKPSSSLSTQQQQHAAVIGETHTGVDSMALTTPANENQLQVKNGVHTLSAVGGGARQNFVSNNNNNFRHSESELPANFHTAAAHSHVNDPALQFTGRFCGGLIADIKRRYRYYVSDYTDGLSPQSIGTILFLFFANFTPLIAFGGLLGDITGGQIAAFESVLGGAFVGIIWALFSGQPLVLMSSTGPVLVFEQIVFDFCGRNGLDYMSFRLWIGIWTTVLLLIMVVTDASALVKYITRFTEETFATLIAVVFIIQALQNLMHITDHYNVLRHPPPAYGVILDECVCQITGSGANSSTLLRVEEGVSRDMCKHWHQNVNKNEHGKLVGHGCNYVPDVFFLSVVLFFGTFLVAKALKSFKTTSFFPTKVRTVISDFGAVIAILLWTLIDMWFGLATPKLEVPSEFKPTVRDEWLVNPLPAGIIWWSIPIAIVPALLGTILIFLDQHITAVIVNRPENKMRKGYGYHLDLLIMAIGIIVCSLFGMPWMVATTVQSMSHVDSLRLESDTSAPGERPQFLGTREQRLTGLGISLMIACSVFLTPVLRNIPMAVLYGIFFYMGISILRSIQFVERVSLFFKPKKYQPDRPYIRHVQINRIHLFTFVELLSLIAVCALKYIKQTAMFFPVMILALVFIRKILGSVFSPYELSYLDDIMPESAWCGRRKKRYSLSTSSINGTAGGAGGGMENAAPAVGNKNYFQTTTTSEKISSINKPTNLLLAPPNHSRQFSNNNRRNINYSAPFDTPMDETEDVGVDTALLTPSAEKETPATATITVVAEHDTDDDGDGDEVVATAAIRHDENSMQRRLSENNANSGGGGNANNKPRQRKTSKRYSLRSAPHYSLTPTLSTNSNVPELMYQEDERSLAAAIAASAAAAKYEAEKLV